VLVDLVLQQEHHLSHLEQMKASLDADMANLDMLLSMDTDTPDATALSSAPEEAARSIGSLSTDSAAACSTGVESTGIESNLCGGGSHSSGFSGVAPALAQMHPWQQQQQQHVQQPQLQVQQWQQGSASFGSDCGSDTPVGTTMGTAMGSASGNGNRMQYIQVRRFM
jgi:hypothetical protein